MASKIPTKHKIEYSCGHTVTEDLKKRFPNKPTTRLNPGFADFLSEKNKENERVCSECFKTQRQQDDSQWLLDIEAFEQKYQLPSFDGTDKQLAHEGLVQSAMKSRHSVLAALFEDPEDEAKQRHAELLDAARAVAHINFWTDNDGRHGGLGYGLRKDYDYGQPEFIETLLNKHQEEQHRTARGEDTEHIETENPY